MLAAGTRRVLAVSKPPAALRPLQDGKMKGLAFVKDPDGYWIEILSNKELEMVVNWPGNQE